MSDSIGQTAAMLLVFCWVVISWAVIGQIFERLMSNMYDYIGLSERSMLPYLIAFLILMLFFPALQQYALVG